MCENKQANREENLFKLNLEAVENLNKPLWKMSLASMNFWLIKFIQELTDKDGDVYPEKNIYQIVCSIRCYLEEHRRAEANILNGKNYR